MTLFSMARNICLQLESCMCFVLRKTTSVNSFRKHTEDLHDLNQP